MKRVVLTPNPYRDKGFRCAQAAERILRSAGMETRMCLPFRVEKGFELPHDLKLSELDEELPAADLLICFGGDGTILHISKQATYNDVPILGVNIGTLGFMAGIEYDELNMLERLVVGDYTVDNRIMLDVSITRAGKVIHTDLALNDAVVTKGGAARIIPMSVLCDGVETTTFSGDGIILCTPTGSTAYSLSAGGPIVEPNAENLIVTPICAHALHTKSFVLGADREASVCVGRLMRKTAFLSVDGGRAFKLFSGDVVSAKRSKYLTRLIKLKPLSFYGIINNKFEK